MKKSKQCNTKGIMEIILQGMRIQFLVTGIDIILTTPCYTKREAYNKKRKVQKLTNKLLRVMEKEIKGNPEAEEKFQEVKRKTLERSKNLNFPVSMKYPKGGIGEFIENNSTYPKGVTMVGHEIIIRKKPSKK